MQRSDLLSTARTLGVPQNELDSAADAKDMRAVLIQLIAKGASEREEPDDEESDDDEDDEGALVEEDLVEPEDDSEGEHDEDDGDNDRDNSLVDLQGRRRRRKGWIKGTRRRRRRHWVGYNAAW